MRLYLHSTKMDLKLVRRIQLCTLLIIGLTLGNDAAAPDVTISQGTVRGLSDTTLRGREYFAYKGIPYAKPPIGELRFKPPVPVDPSEDLIIARLDGPYCVQRNYFLETPLTGGSEDCLSVNVYTPQITEGVQLPVMVFIHGGAWLAGSGASYIFGAQQMLDKDVVVVTFNYRVGAIGFLSTGDASCPGNNGMKDQVALLKWVQSNIGAFGGDPGSVTIFGQSAGGASVHLHLLSDMSAALFQYAISESASALDVWAWPPEPLPMAQQTAAVFSCPQDNTTLLVECLRQVDAIELTNSGDIFKFWSTDPITMFRPVAEQPWDGSSEEPFLTGNPYELIRTGAFQKKPWINGAVAQEGILRGVPILADPVLLAELNDNWNTLGPMVFDLWSSIDDPLVVDDMWKNMTNFYFNDNLPLTGDNGINFIDMYSDRFFMHGIHKSALLQVANGHDQIYMYNFNYQGMYSYADSLAEYPINYGIGHSDDLIYLFEALGLFPPWPANHPDLKVVDSLVTLWTNFAIYGTPTPPAGAGLSSVSCDAYSTTSDDRCDLSDLAWLPVQPGGRTSYLDISLNNNTNTLDFTNQQDFYKERMAFWDSANLRENLP